MERLTDKDFRIGFDDSDRLPSYVPIYEKLRNYEDLEEQGKLLKLPCAVGNTVYSLDRFCSGSSLDCPSRPCESCEDYQLEIYEGKFKLNDINDFGKTVFLTKEAAESALKGAHNE